MKFRPVLQITYAYHTFCSIPKRRSVINLGEVSFIYLMLCCFIHNLLNDVSLKIRTVLYHRPASAWIVQRLYIYSDKFLPITYISVVQPAGRMRPSDLSFLALQSHSYIGSK
jgi:hypothetical protein